jgi:hypothetical protein
LSIWSSQRQQRILFSSKDKNPDALSPMCDFSAIRLGSGLAGNHPEQSAGGSVHTRR